MALQGSDLFVIQSQSDNQLYKLRLDALSAALEGGGGVTFKGSVDLNNAPSAQLPNAVTLPANPGDMYIVESEAPIIASGWVMQGSETSAEQGDRIIYDGDDNNWILITSGSDNAGTVTEITASLPLKSDGDPVSPALSIREARTASKASTDGDGEGTDGAVR